MTRRTTTAPITTKLPVSRSCTKNLEGEVNALSPFHKSPFRLPGNQLNRTNTSVCESIVVTADPYISNGRRMAMHRKATPMAENAHQFQPRTTMRAHRSVRTATAPRIGIVLPTKSFDVAKARPQTRVTPRIQKAKRGR
jgi:hypothetical protein